MMELTTAVHTLDTPAFFGFTEKEQIESLDTDCGTWRLAKITNIAETQQEIGKYEVSVVYDNFSGSKARRTISVDLRHKVLPIRSISVPMEMPKKRSYLQFNPEVKIYGDHVYTSSGESVTTWQVLFNDPMNRRMALIRHNPCDKQILARVSAAEWPDILLRKTTSYDILANPPRSDSNTSPRKKLRIVPAVTNMAVTATPAIPEVIPPNAAVDKMVIAPVMHDTVATTTVLSATTKVCVKQLLIVL